MGANELPVLAGGFAPIEQEVTMDLTDIEGEVPKDLTGMYVRNGPNRRFEAQGRYHWFDGDGMLHAVRFEGGKVQYQNRWVMTDGLKEELAAGSALWQGIKDPPRKDRPDAPMKNTSNTDVKFYAGNLVSMWYLGGAVYQCRPDDLSTVGKLEFDDRMKGLPVSAHSKVDERTGEFLFFAYGKQAPYMHYGVMDRHGKLQTFMPVQLPGPRLPHDMAFTEHYAILNDFPLAWDAELLAKQVYRPKLHDLPSRFGVVPRRGGEVRWFDAAPTYVLHFINAYEDGDTIVLDGYFQEDPLPRPDPADGPHAALKKMVDVHAMKARPHRWRLDLRTGRASEERLFDDISEFPSIHYAVPGRKHRYAWAMTAPPGWFLFDGIVRYDLETGATQRFQYPAGTYASESPMAPAPGATAEDAGWLVTFTAEPARDRSECHVFDAAHVDAGPIARVALPARIASGTHACWAPGDSLRATL
jgi:carotenoid cleavage dioxygenase